MQDTLSEIICNEQIKGDYWRLRLKTGWKSFIPGQFVMVEVPGGETLLRRPFGIARLEKGVVELCYKVVGKGTRILSKVPVGAKSYVLGPIGNGFNVGSQRSAVRALVAGGYGIAPLLGLAEKLKGQETHLFYGARNSEHLLYIKEFKKLGVKVHISTEDGSMGEKGLITDALKKFLKATGHESRVAVFACGPHGMLSAVQLLVASCSSLNKPAIIDCQLSLESYMACGIGVCVGCVVKDTNGNFVRVCKEGPVFKAECVNV